jgi:hypothetical protein
MGREMARAESTDWGWEEGKGRENGGELNGGAEEEGVGCGGKTGEREGRRGLGSRLLRGWETKVEREGGGASAASAAMARRHRQQRQQQHQQLQGSSYGRIQSCLT